MAWYREYEKHRDVDDFALWFCVWNRVPGKTGLELYHLPNRGLDVELDLLSDRVKSDPLKKYKVWSKKLDQVTGGDQKQVQAQIDAFGELFAKFVEMQPADHYGIKTTGHGSHNSVLGDVFGLGYGRALFTKIREVLGGKKLTFLDLSSNCNEGSYFILDQIATGVDYYLGSSLKVGGILPKGEDRRGRPTVK